jgi:hypothetical protein
MSLPLYALPFAASAGLLLARHGASPGRWPALALALLVVAATFAGFLRLARQDPWRRQRILAAGATLHLPCLAALVATALGPTWLAAVLVVLAGLLALGQCLTVLATIGAAGRMSGAAFSAWLANLALAGAILVTT